MSVGAPSSAEGCQRSAKAVVTSAPSPGAMVNQSGATITVSPTTRTIVLAVGPSSSGISSVTSSPTARPAAANVAGPRATSWGPTGARPRLITGLTPPSGSMNIMPSGRPASSDSPSHPARARCTTSGVEASASSRPAAARSSHTPTKPSHQPPDSSGWPWTARQRAADHGHGDEQRHGDRQTGEPDTSPPTHAAAFRGQREAHTGGGWLGDARIVAERPTVTVRPREPRTRRRGSRRRQWRRRGRSGARWRRPKARDRARRGGPRRRG